MPTQNFVDNVTVVQASWLNDVDEVVFETVLKRNGTTNPTTNLPMAGFKHTGAGSATASGQYLVYGQSDANLGTGATITSDNLPIGYNGTPIDSLQWANGKALTTSTNVTLNASDMAAGFGFMCVNTSGSSITLTQGSGVTLRLAGSGTTGSRTIAGYGQAFIWCISSSEAYVTGPGVT